MSEVEVDEMLRLISGQEKEKVGETNESKWKEEKEEEEEREKAEKKRGSSEKHR